jgi:hypothetical protein
VTSCWARITVRRCWRMEGQAGRQRRQAVYAQQHALVEGGCSRDVIRRTATADGAAVTAQRRSTGALEEGRRRQAAQRVLMPHLPISDGVEMVGAGG